MRATRRCEAGFGLIEVIFAMVILGVALIPIAGLSYTVARQSNRSAQVTMMGTLQQTLTARLQNIAFDSLPGRAGCVSGTRGVLVYTQCATITTVSAKLRRATVVITASGYRAPRPDTSVIDVARPSAASLLGK